VEQENIENKYKTLECEQTSAKHQFGEPTSQQLFDLTLKIT
jgi:hypothetical protein